MDLQEFLKAYYSSTLFCPNGIPLRFYVPPNRMKKNLKACIENGGGEVFNADKNCIRLLLPGIECKLDEMIACEFVLDSIKENALQSIENYKVCKGMKYVKKVLTTERFKSPKRKILYTLEDDEKMLNFLMVDKRYVAAKGGKVWILAESKKITDHSWQSMKARFTDQIMKNLESYTFLSDSAKNKLRSLFSEKGLPPPSWKNDFLTSMSIPGRSKLNSSSIKKNSNSEKNIIKNVTGIGKCNQPAENHQDSPCENSAKVYDKKTTELVNPTNINQNNLKNKTLLTETKSTGLSEVKAIDEHNLPPQNLQNLKYTTDARIYNQQGAKLTKTMVLMNIDQKSLLTGLKSNSVSELHQGVGHTSEHIEVSELGAFLRHGKSDSTGMVTESQATSSSLGSVFREFNNMQDNMREFIQKRDDSLSAAVDCTVAKNNCYSGSSNVFVKPAWSQIPERIAYINSRKGNTCQQEIHQECSSAYSKQYVADIMKLEIALEWLNVPSWVLKGALFFNNGNLDLAIHWLLNYPALSARTFNCEDDRLLLEGKDMNRILAMYGTGSVLERRSFLKMMGQALN